MQARPGPIKDIVIVGGGPIGMYMAIKLKQQGLNPILIEKRSHFTRPGRLEPEIFTLVSVSLQKERSWADDDYEIKPSSSYHIKDLERELERILKEENITVIKGEYINLSNNSINVRLSSGQPKAIPCDLVFDATGSDRKVLSTINKIYEDKHEAPPFHFSDVGYNPIKKHFIAYVGMEPNDIKELKNNQTKVDDTLHSFKFPEKHLKGIMEKLIEISKLRQQFGWSNFSMPQCVVRPLEKNKVCLYLEMPENLKTHKDYEAWVKAVLKLQTNKDVPFAYLKTSEKYKLNPKPRFQPIFLQPKETTPFCFMGTNFPDIIPIGDALIDPDYRRGLGIGEGIIRADALLESMQFQHGVIKEIDFKKYNESLELSLEKQRKQMMALFIRRSKSLEIDYHLLIKKYLDVPSESDRSIIFDEVVKDLSKPGKENIAIEIANELYDESKKGLREAVSDINKLHYYHTLLLDALKILPEDRKDDKIKIMSLIEEITTKTKECDEKPASRPSP